MEMTNAEIIITLRDRVEHLPFQFDNVEEGRKLISNAQDALDEYKNNFQKYIKSLEVEHCE